MTDGRNVGRGSHHRHQEVTRRVVVRRLFRGVSQYFVVSSCLSVPAGVDERVRWQR